MTTNSLATRGTKTTTIRAALAGRPLRLAGLPLLLAGLFMATLSAGSAVAQEAAQQVNDAQVQAAIDRGVAYIISQQKPDGKFTENGEMDWTPAGSPIRGALDAMAMLGLAFAEVDVKSEPMQKGLNYLVGVDMDKTYSVATRIMVLSRLLKKLDIEHRERVKAVLQRDLVWLLKAQSAEGGWGYNTLDNKVSAAWDFSNTQIALLALQEALLAGFELSPEPFLKAQKLYLDFQHPDGGWGYGVRGGFQATGDAQTSYGSMTAAAVASLYLIRDFLYRDLGCPCNGGKSKLRPAGIDEAINRGLEWLGKSFIVDNNPGCIPKRWTLYWLYSCERVGLSAGLKYFGTHNWYAEGANHLLTSQTRSGYWMMGGENPADTSYAICFLIKGRAPILFNKLKFDGQWDNHPRDMFNLSRHVATQKEQPINWQIIPLDVPVEEWHDAPILYITAETIMTLSDEQKKKLRRFTDTGGTIFFEASCGNKPVALWWEKTCKEIWPEWELKALDKEHPVYTSDQKILRPLPRMLTMDDGVRSIIFYSPMDVSCTWNTMGVASRKELFDLGSNLYAYTTDKRRLRARLARYEKVTNKDYSAATITAGSRSALNVARIKHGGDFYVGRNYDAFTVLGQAMKDGRGPTVAMVGEKVPSELKAAEVQVAWMTGRKGVSLSDPEAKALGDYLKAGGFLLLEANLGDKRFDDPARALLKQLGAEVKAITEADDLLAGRMGGASGYPVKTVHFKPALTAERVGQAVPELFGIYLAGKLVGVYSPFDLLYAQAGYDAWGSRGYETEDALAITTNILLQVSSQP